MFEICKKNALFKADKSKKGSIDDNILDLVNKINNNNDFYTTSSCSGRIVLIEIPVSMKKQEAEWLFITHDYVVEKTEILNLLNKHEELSEVWFRFEPVIIHVGCRSIEKAQDLINFARSIGLKKSGIQSTKEKIIVELSCGDLIDTILVKDKERLVADDYIDVLITQANKKLNRTHEKIKKLESFF